MKNRLSGVAILLTAILALAILALKVSAQQTSPPAAVTQAETASTQPMHIGGPIRPPKVMYSVEPSFSKEDGKAGRSFTAQVYLWVDENGVPSHVRMVRSAGPSADEKIIAAVQQYKFKPATLDGKPVAVDLYIGIFIDRF